MNEQMAKQKHGAAYSSVSTVLQMYLARNARTHVRTIETEAALSLAFGSFAALSVHHFQSQSSPVLQFFSLPLSVPSDSVQSFSSAFPTRC